MNAPHVDRKATCRFLTNRPRCRRRDRRCVEIQVRVVADDVPHVSCDHDRSVANRESVSNVLWPGGPWNTEGPGSAELGVMPLQGSDECICIHDVECSVPALVTRLPRQRKSHLRNVLRDKLISRTISRTAYRRAAQVFCGAGSKAEPYV